MRQRLGPALTHEPAPGNGAGGRPRGGGGEARSRVKLPRTGAKRHGASAQASLTQATPRRRYASLYFLACVDEDDNELIVLETIHHFVEVRAG